jgi:hypothetical protein
MSRPKPLPTLGAAVCSRGAGAMMRYVLATGAKQALAAVLDAAQRGLTEEKLADILVSDC